jgi:hypothetical protein
MASTPNATPIPKQIIAKNVFTVAPSPTKTKLLKFSVLYATGQAQAPSPAVRSRARPEEFPNFGKKKLGNDDAR